MEFSEWLEDVRGFSHKVSHDIVSRLRRVLQIVGKNKISKDTITVLETKGEFNSLSMCVKSQLRRSIRLYMEYQGEQVNR